MYDCIIIIFAGTALKVALINQHCHPPNFAELFGSIDMPDLNELFVKKRPRFNKRTSSAVWEASILLPKTPWIVNHHDWFLICYLINFFNFMLSLVWAVNIVDTLSSLLIFYVYGFWLEEFHGLRSFKHYDILKYEHAFVESDWFEIINNWRWNKDLVEMVK